jgi:hypothetical protein
MDSSAPNMLAAQVGDDGKLYGPKIRAVYAAVSALEKSLVVSTTFRSVHCTTYCLSILGKPCSSTRTHRLTKIIMNYSPVRFPHNQWPTAPRIFLHLIKL